MVNKDRAKGSGRRAAALRRAQGLALRDECSKCTGRALSPLPSALLIALVVLFSATSASAQAVGGADKARPVAGDPGLSTMVVLDQPEYRVLRDYAEPGATRRMHSHDDATWHVFTLVTGQLLLTIEGESPVEVTQGQVLNLKGGAKHTFRNTGTVTATIVEVFGKAPKP
jgi:quercetin dioxygenase-like cupin family protein